MKDTALLTALTEARDYLKVLLDAEPDEATDLLTNSGEEVEERLTKAIDEAVKED